MGRALIFLILLLSPYAFGSDLTIGVKLYSDGLYSLAAKTFRENFNSLLEKGFKDFYRYAYLSFLKSSDYSSLKELVKLWKEKYPNFKRGELLALELILKLKEGASIEEAFPEELLSLPISEKVDFFKVLSEVKLKPEDALYILKVSSKSTDLKGAVKDSGFLKVTLKRAIKDGDYVLIDFIFDNYGKWFKGKDEALQFVRYLERKKRFSDALIEAEKLYKSYPSRETRLELGRVYYLTGKYNKVLSLIKEPEDERERYLLAWTYFKLNEPMKIASLVGLNTEKPKPPRSLELLLDFYRGNFDLKALESAYPDLYVKALIFSFSNQVPEGEVGLSHDLAYIYWERGYFERAREELKRAIQRPQDRNLTARTLFLLGRIGSVNSEVGSVVYNQLMSSYQGTPYYRESIVPAAKVYLYSGSPKVAVKLLSYAYSQLGKKDQEVKELLGRGYTVLGDFKRASLYLSKVKTQVGKTLLSYSLFNLGKREQAYSVLRDLVKKGPIFPEVNGGRFIYLSKLLRKEKDLKGVNFGVPVVDVMATVVSRDLKRGEELLRSLPQRERVVLSYFLVEVYGDKEPKKAINFVTELINSSSDEETLSFARRLLNYFAFKTGNFAPVLLNDPKFIAYNPENDITSTSTLISKAEDYVVSGELNKAYGLLKLALERTSSPDLRREIVRKMVNIDLKLANYSRAVKDVALIPKGTKDDDDLRNFLLFKIYLKMGKLVEAYEHGKKVSSLENIPEKERPSFIAKLARYYKLTGDKERALGLVRELLKERKLSNVDYDDLISLSILAQEKGELDLARRLVGEAIKVAKTKDQKAESLFWKASIEAKEGKVDDSIIDYLKIAYQFKGVEPWSSTALYRAAQLFEEKGDYKQALKLYRKVSELKKGTKEGEVAAEKVKSLLKKLGMEE